MSTSFYFRALWARLPMRQSAFLSVLAAILLMGLLIASPVQSAAVPAPNAAAALLAWWSFDGALTDDADGYDLQTSGPPAQFIPGCQGEAAYFADNAGEYFQRPGSDAAFDFAANDYSIELLLRYDSPPSYSHEQAILEKCGGQDCTTQGWGVTSLSHNAFRFFNNDGVNHIALESPRQNLVAGHWYHLAVVRQGSAASIYLDGQLIASDPLGRPPWFRPPAHRSSSDGAAPRKSFLCGARWMRSKSTPAR